MFITLIISPEARKLLFPPTPIALVDSLSGGVTKPNAVMLGSTDSVTGAPENIKGEALENEASNFVTALGAIAMNVILGKDPQGEPNKEEHGINVPMPEPNKMATMVATIKDKAEGIDKPSQDKTKVPMETIMWSKMRPLLHNLTLLNDTWERFVNALNPQPPFDSETYRRRIAKAIVPLAVVSIFLTRDAAIRGLTFLIGVGFFGDPILRSAYRQFPIGLAELNSTIFYGVPTNNQLALTLLRLGEARQTPLPPPPHINKPPSKTPIALTDEELDTVGDDQPLGASDLELEEAAEYDHEMVKESGGQDAEVTQHNSKKHTKVLDFIKKGAKAAVKTGATVEKARAKTGNEGAKNRVGVIPSSKRPPVVGPVEFDARYEGQKGYLYLNTSAPIPLLAFNKVSATQNHGGVADQKDLQTVWSMPIGNITAMRKHSGFGFKSKLMAGWALDEEVNDSLGLSDKSGNEWPVTAIPRRDELFNRLIAIGDQKWETW